MDTKIRCQERANDECIVRDVCKKDGRTERLNSCKRRETKQSRINIKEKMSLIRFGAKFKMWQRQVGFYAEFKNVLGIEFTKS